MTPNRNWIRDNNKDNFGEISVHKSYKREILIRVRVCTDLLPHFVNINAVRVAGRCMGFLTIEAKN